MIINSSARRMGWQGGMYPPAWAVHRIPHAQDGKRMYRAMYRSRYEQRVEGRREEGLGGVWKHHTVAAVLGWTDSCLGGAGRSWASLDTLGHAGTSWELGELEVRRALPDLARRCTVALRWKRRRSHVEEMYMSIAYIYVDVEFLL